jgi:hypothetical protein
MSFNYASRYRLKNKSTGNLIAQSNGWSHQNGLLCYGGSNLSDDQIWYFLSVDSNGYKITNFLYPGWVITESPENNVFVYLGPDQLNQHWTVAVIQEDYTYLYITNQQTGDALLDQNASGANGNLSALPVAEADPRALWRLVEV